MILRATFIWMPYCVMFKMLEVVSWPSEESSTTSCEGENKLLTWKHSIEKNGSLIEYKWFFNSTTLIAQYSESRGFRAVPFYKGRIEQSGTTGIVLKRLSLNDTGYYTLYTKLTGVQNQIFQSILLRVYEPPTYQCKPNIIIHSKNVLSCSPNTCGRHHLSPEWRILGKSDPVGNESYLEIESSWTYELVFCCLQGPDMKCHNGNMYAFCVSTSIASADEDITNKSAPLILVVSVSSFVIITVIIVVSVCCYRKLKSLVAMSQNADIEERLTTRHEVSRNEPESTVSEWREENMTERLRIVNNINIDPEVFKNFLDSKRKRRNSIKENTKHLRRLYHKERPLQFQKRQKLKDPSYGLTMTTSGKPDRNADTSAAFDYTTI